MSEEAAFLEALKANPADDTARLVYADWLDEHDEPAKAEYLRVVAKLNHAGQDNIREQSDVARMFKLAEALPQEWLTEIGMRFEVKIWTHNDEA